MIALTLTPDIAGAKKRFAFTSSALAADEIDLSWAAAIAHADFGSIAQAFAANVIGLLSTVGMPAQLALASAERSHWQRIFTAERIRALTLEGDEAGMTPEGLKAHEHQVALAAAKKKMAAFVASPAGCQVIAEDACRILLDSIEDPHMSQAAEELLRQGTVLLWGAFEVLARDVFVALLDARPGLASILSTHPETKSRFGLKALSLETLAASSFDVSRCMGTILADTNDLSDLATVRSTYSALFPKEMALHAALNSASLWKLAQRRHLIVHRRGIVDRRYLETTGDAVSIGAPLIVSPSSLEVEVAEVVAVGRLLVDAAIRASIAGTPRYPVGEGPGM